MITSEDFAEMSDRLKFIALFDEISKVREQCINLERDLQEAKDRVQRLERGR